MEYHAPEKYQDKLPKHRQQCKLLEASIVNSNEVDLEENLAKVKVKAPWLGWCCTYVFVLLLFSAYRWATLDALISMYGDNKETTLTVEIRVLLLGLLEDVVCTTYFACVLWIFDVVIQAVKKHFKYQGGRDHTAFEKQKVVARIVSNVVTFFVSWILFVIIVAPFVADMLLVRLRELRFSFDLIIMAINERKYISVAPIATEEFNAGFINGAVVLIAATVFATARTKTRWCTLARWNPLHAAVWIIDSRVMTPRGRTTIDKSSCKNSDQHYNYNKLALEEGTDTSNTSKSFGTTRINFTTENTCHQRCSQIAVILVGIVVFPVIVFGISRSSSPLVAYSALNMSLNQLFPKVMLPIPKAILEQDIGPTFHNVWAERYIHYLTEEHQLFGDNTLYRQTTGFRGDLAFNVSIDHEYPPNVILLSIESFRFHDSRYLVGEEDPSNLLKGTNITVTPNFDRWAKRGVSFRNMWSSLPTSRSLESLLFAQVPYDNVVAATAGGREDTKLSGLPQLLSSKGYETFFTTGCALNYDGWDTFIDSHGFDTVWGRTEMKKLAESDMNITRDQWDGPEQRKFSWGVHDDVSFQLVGDLLVNKTKEQSTRIARGDPKKPMFITHYTISSHTPFRARPAWYDEMEKPDFSALYEGEGRPNTIKNYLEMRYFTDMELGKFMDRMDKEGILNDTIVIIVGDHGRAPEFNKSDTRDVSVTRVPATIIAEGRLGESVGLVIDDAVEHYDILNTLADIVGVPDGGFVQDGVGRSLKRKIPFGERVVFSNNPSRKMSVIRGHLRLQYDRIADSVLLHNADTDHDMKVDLFPDLTTEEQTEWLLWRDIGRDLSRYFVDRWDGNCLLSVNCTGAA